MLVATYQETPIGCPFQRIEQEMRNGVPTIQMISFLLENTAQRVKMSPAIISSDVGI